jgi:hypothetical protein
LSVEQEFSGFIPNAVRDLLLLFCKRHSRSLTAFGMKPERNLLTAHRFPHPSANLRFNGSATACARAKPARTTAVDGFLISLLIAGSFG